MCLIYSRTGKKSNFFYSVLTREREKKSHLDGEIEDWDGESEKERESESKKNETKAAKGKMNCTGDESWILIKQQLRPRAKVVGGSKPLTCDSCNFFSLLPNSLFICEFLGVGSLCMNF